jgi:hypothetical protein
MHPTHASRMLLNLVGTKTTVAVAQTSLTEVCIPAQCYFNTTGTADVLKAGIKAIEA